MLYNVLLLFGGAIGYALFKIVAGLRKNIAAARKTGLPYWVVPLSPWNRVGSILSPLWVPLFKKLPQKYWKDIEETLSMGWQYRHNHRQFEKIGSQAFVLASPGNITMYTESAEVMHQITSKREAFPKPTEPYAIVRMYGQNVITLEGAAWRQHRKVVSASFNEKNAALVLKETISQLTGLIKIWLGPDGKGNRTFRTLEHDTAAFTLNIIGNIGFGLKILWPGETLPADVDPKLAKYADRERAPEGHTMSFVGSLQRTMDYLVLNYLVPKWLLRALPFQHTKNAIEAESNFVSYLDEFIRDKAEDVRTGHINEQGMDLMGSLVRTSYGEKSSSDGKDFRLTDAEIMGNAFVNIVAGHETTANVLHFTLAELACNPASQRRLQKDVDEILGDSDPTTWEYDDVINPLLASMIGACINETLRLVPPLSDIPKRVSPTQEQPLMMNGEEHILPPDMTIGMITAAAQRCPRYWPTKPSRITPSNPHDLDDWVPERWFQTDKTDLATADAVVEGADTEDFGGFTGSDTSAQLYRPPPGSFIPFSAGARACLGRRIALVELVSSVAFIFQRYSVELAVDEFVPNGDAGVEAMTEEAKAETYLKAQTKCRETINRAFAMITLALHGKHHIPLRLVKRGEEKFVNMVDPTF